MKVRVLRTFLGNEGLVQDGDVLDIADARARELEASGLVTPLVTGSMKPKERTPGEQSPTITRPSGGPTGAAKPASSSEEGPAPAKRTSWKRRGKRG
jgi:hypothetical protein